MTAKKFPLVFDKVSLSAPLQEVFRETTVLSLTIHRKEREIVTEIAADEVIPPLYWEKLRKEMIRQRQMCIRDSDAAASRRERSAYFPEISVDG